MNKISLKYYTKSNYQLQFFDLFMKNNGHRKEDVFKELYINNSSYRRAKEYSQKIGEEIVQKLCEKFDYSIIDDTKITEIEELLNNIYYDLYYKIYDSYDLYFQKINELIDNKSILEPFLVLFKLLMMVNANKSVNILYKENIDLYNNIKPFKKYFQNGFIEIYDVLSLFFEESLDECQWNHDFNNALAYQILGSKNYKSKKYIECIFYSYKSLDILIEDCNYKRVIQVNQMIISSLLNIGNYEETLALTTKQIKTIKSLSIFDSYYKNATNCYYISLLGLKKYEEILKDLNENNINNFITLTCYLVALYKTNENEYFRYYSEELDVNSYDEVYQKYFISLNKYLIENDKKILKELQISDLHTAFSKIFKNI